MTYVGIRENEPLSRLEVMAHMRKKVAFQESFMLLIYLWITLGKYLTKTIRLASALLMVNRPMPH
ncbi:MAG: hypothetical protein ACI8PW_001490 [Methylophilaceae bacterium]|jgi:hypothetical protein